MKINKRCFQTERATEAQRDTYQKHIGICHCPFELRELECIENCLNCKHYEGIK